jgi:hypothetical protein
VLTTGIVVGIEALEGGHGCQRRLQKLGAKGMHPGGDDNPAALVPPPQAVVEPAHQ